MAGLDPAFRHLPVAHRALHSTPVEPSVAVEPAS